MTFLSDMLSLLPTVLTAISAIAAASIAYLNYRSRPILIRTIERHSDDLKALVSIWKGELPIFRWLEDGLFPNVEFPLSVESEFLFADMWSHVPSDLSLREAWTRFRLIAEEHYNARNAFMNSLHAEMRASTGLTLDNSMDRPGYTTELPTFLFQDTFQMLKHSRLPNRLLSISHSRKGELDLLLLGSHVIATGNPKDVEKVESVWLSFVEQMEKTNLSLFKSALSLVQQESEFWHTREVLVRLMNEFAAVPIYSRRCIYVKRAEEAGRNLKSRKSKGAD